MVLHYLVKCLFFLCICHLIICVRSCFDSFFLLRTNSRTDCVTADGLLRDVFHILVTDEASVPNCVYQTCIQPWIIQSCLDFTARPVSLSFEPAGFPFTTGPALGMFKVFGRTGPPTLHLKILYKLTCQFERLWCLDYGANTDINDVEWNWVCFKNQKCYNQMHFASIQCSKIQLRPGPGGEVDSDAQ